jgi:hypothetical protein
MAGEGRSERETEMEMILAQDQVLQTKYHAKIYKE